jgi:hypothetical protein
LLEGAGRQIFIGRTPLAYGEHNGPQTRSRLPHGLLTRVLPSAVLGLWLGAALTRQARRDPLGAAAQDGHAERPDNTVEPAAANWRRDASGDLMYPLDRQRSARILG